MLVLFGLPEGVALLDTGDLVQTDGAILMREWKGSLQWLFREGLCLACLEFRFIDLQLAFLSLPVAEALDGLVGIVREVS